MRHQLAAVLVITAIAQVVPASVPLPPDSEVTIHFRGVGADHVLRALGEVATSAGYACSPRVAEDGRVSASERDTPPRGPLLRCEIPQLGGGGASIWLEASLLLPGEMSITFFRFDSGKAFVDRVIADLEGTIVSDPLLESIEQRSWRMTPPGYFKIK